MMKNKISILEIKKYLKESDFKFTIIKKKKTKKKAMDHYQELYCQA